MNAERRKREKNMQTNDEAQKKKDKEIQKEINIQRIWENEGDKMQRE